MPSRVYDLEPTGSISELVEAMSRTAFNGRRLGEAAMVFRTMTQASDCVRFLGIAGAATPAGLRRLISRLISERMVDLVVSTGANITHDLAMALGARHFWLEGDTFDDRALRSKKKVRIYDLVLGQEGFRIVENKVAETVNAMASGQYSSHEIIWALGKGIGDSHSMVKSALEARVPIIVPALHDSVLGLQFWSLGRPKAVYVDESKDLRHIIDVQFDAKRRGFDSGALILGGGVPKNYILQSALISDHPFKYVIQVSTDVPEYGGSSGATIQEAISWGKVHPKAKTCTVYCDMTIALPIIACYALRPPKPRHRVR